MSSSLPKPQKPKTLTLTVSLQPLLTKHHPVSVTASHRPHGHRFSAVSQLPGLMTAQGLMGRLGDFADQPVGEGVAQ
jgi:hypothetical protein